MHTHQSWLAFRMQSSSSIHNNIGRMQILCFYSTHIWVVEHREKTILVIPFTPIYNAPPFQTLNALFFKMNRMMTKLSTSWTIVSPLKISCRLTDLDNVMFFYINSFGIKSMIYFSSIWSSWTIMSFLPYLRFRKTMWWGRTIILKWQSTHLTRNQT